MLVKPEAKNSIIVTKYELSGLLEASQMDAECKQKMYSVRQNGETKQL